MVLLSVSSVFSSEQGQVYLSCAGKKGHKCPGPLGLTVGVKVVKVKISMLCCSSVDKDISLQVSWGQMANSCKLLWTSNMGLLGQWNSIPDLSWSSERSRKSSWSPPPSFQPTRGQELLTPEAMWAPCCSGYSVPTHQDSHCSDPFWTFRILP